MILHKTGIALAAFAALASLSACATAKMSLPPALQSGHVTSIVGIGGGEKGNFAFAGNAGAFTRSAQRLSFFEVYTLQDGGSKFSLSGPDFSAPLDAACTMKQRTVTFNIVEFRPVPMAYACEFKSGGAVIPATFEVQAAERGFNNREERRGRVGVDGAMLDIRSVHAIEGAALPTSTPMGYVFEKDGQAIGAIDLNYGPRIVEAPGASVAERRAMRLAVIALAVFWDPAQTET